MKKILLLFLLLPILLSGINQTAYDIVIDKDIELINNSIGCLDSGLLPLTETCLIKSNRQPNKSKQEIKMEQLVEQIKPIKDFEGHYSISNYGYVISEARSYVSGKGKISTKEKTILKGIPNHHGYLMVGLCNSGIRKKVCIHTLVWDYFGDGQRNKMVLTVDHKDGNKLKNRIDNLQLLTNRENVSKGYKNKKTSSKYTGVSFNPIEKNWRARIMINGKDKHLGRFKTENKAHLAYQNALEELNES